MSGVSRRRLLGGTAAAVVTTAAGGSLVGGCSDSTTTSAAPARQWYGFTGLHQHGVATAPQENAIVAAFDTVAGDRDELRAMFRALTREVSDLMNGVVTAPVDDLLPPSDNLIVGVEPPADDLTIAIGVGSSLFDDDRYGLAAKMPRQLMPMPTFPNDKPDPGRLHGDVVIQIGAGTAETCNHALRRVMRATRDSLVVRWLLPGFNKPNTLGKGRTSVRNLLGFKDGTANLDATDESLLDELVWVHPSDDEPEWAIGGTYQAIRLIRNRVEFWDRTPLRTQETIIGRDKASGAPLGGADETEIPDFAADPDGAKFRLDGHIRLANPRTNDTDKNRILRRGFNYSAGFDRAGQLDQGLLFVCFQRSLVDGFITVQNRLNGEALEEYITPFGGGLFYVLPGVPTADDFLASGLFG
jgi:deferrochelatase/peroxidase EfeB